MKCVTVCEMEATLSACTLLASWLNRVLETDAMFPYLTLVRVCTVYELLVTQLLDCVAQLNVVFGELWHST